MRYFCFIFSISGQEYLCNRVGTTTFELFVEFAVEQTERGGDDTNPIDGNDDDDEVDDNSIITFRFFDFR